MKIDDVPLVNGSVGYSHVGITVYRLGEGDAYFQRIYLFTGEDMRYKIRESNQRIVAFMNGHLPVSTIISEYYPPSVVEKWLNGP